MKGARSVDKDQTTYELADLGSHTSQIYQKGLGIWIQARRKTSPILPLTSHSEGKPVLWISNMAYQFLTFMDKTFAL